MIKEGLEIVETILYEGNEGAVTVEVIIGDETLWTTQKTMSQLFGVEENNITYHLKNIFKTKELDEDSTTQKIRVVQNEGNRKVNRNINFYNLDVIISVGYRINSKQATQFRIWATNILKEYIIKGYALDDELLKKGTRFGKDYFDGLLERIKEIRHLKGDFIKKSRTFMRPAMIIILNQKYLKSFLLWCKINYIMPFQVKQLLN